MYPCLDTTNTDFEKSAGKSIDILVKVKGFKDVRVGNYWIAGEYWTANNVHGNLKDSDIEEWWDIPKSGEGYSVNN